MLTENKLNQLLDLIKGAAKEELIWMNGYISGVIKGEIPAAAQVSQNTIAKKITLVYGTETGNAKKLATELSVKARKNHFVVKLASLDQYRLSDLSKEENLFVVISTQGDGEPPIAAKKFYDHIHLNGFRLDNVKYSVLALGDTSYPLFCKTGEDVDEQLEKLGAKRIVPIQKCDLEYDADADSWFVKVLQTLNEAPVAEAAISKRVAQPGVKTNTKKIYKARVLSNINLNDRGSEKETYHIELSADEAVDYLPGDSIGIVPENPLETVNAIIALTKINKENPVTHKESSYTVFELLKKKVNIHFLHERVIKKYAAIIQQDIPEIKMDLLDLLTIHPLKDATQFEEVLQILPTQSPRIYTIASSNTAHNGEVHLTVEKYAFVVNEEIKTGVCSEYLAGLAENAGFDFFVQKNKRFKLPAEDKDIIMIGPGTGIAAFRSFISERDAAGANGKNWLFFGEEHFASDFLYQTEIQNWFETGVLSKISLAFSKDPPWGISVAHKIIENGKELYQWIQSGAFIYVCGEKAPMSVDTEKALLQVIETYSGLSASASLSYFEQLKEEGRYSKDVY
jgi:sulfite reductase (NADPH) flavoprotein alpha-component